MASDGEALDDVCMKILTVLQDYNKNGDGMALDELWKCKPLSYYKRNTVYWRLRLLCRCGLIHVETRPYTTYERKYYRLAPEAEVKEKAMKELELKLSLAGVT